MLKLNVFFLPFPPFPVLTPTPPIPNTAPAVFPDPPFWPIIKSAGVFQLELPPCAD